MTGPGDIGASVAVTGEAHGCPLLLRGADGRDAILIGEPGGWMLEARRRGRVVRRVRRNWEIGTLIALVGWLQWGIRPQTVEDLPTDPRWRRR